MMAGGSGVGCYCGIRSKLKSTQELYKNLQNLADESMKSFEYFPYANWNLR